MNNKSQKGILYLIPVKLGESDFNAVFPELNKNIILSIKIFIIEDVRSARRFLKSINYPGNFDDVNFYILNEHTKKEETTDYLDEIFKGNDIGILSEAGMPCIADPGNTIVQYAHRKNIKITSLIGPSSIFLSLAASGFNGQHFTFCGYIPIKDGEKSKRIKELEKRAWKHKQTQIFIETPYRNIKLFESLLINCQSETMLCIACDLTLKDEYIKTKSISEWKKQIPPIHKRPTVFLLSK
jgi:16S rRNA (cytidine1402-2'-O)-methyltransferase